MDFLFLFTTCLYAFYIMHSCCWMLYLRRILVGTGFGGSAVAANKQIIKFIICCFYLILICPFGKKEHVMLNSIHLILTNLCQKLNLDDIQANFEYGSRSVKYLVIWSLNAFSAFSMLFGSNSNNIHPIFPNLIQDLHLVYIGQIRMKVIYA